MRLKIINLNVWIGGILWDNLIEFLKKEDADILLLQEVYNGDISFKKVQYRSFTELMTNLNYKYSHFAPAFIETATDEREKEVVQGNAILSKFPLKEIAVRFYDVPFSKFSVRGEKEFQFTPRCLQHVLVTLGGQRMHILNTQGIWGTHGKDTKRRLKMADYIVAEVANNAPLILAGDFNVREKTKTIEKIEAKLTNVFKDELVTSFNLARKDISKFPGFADSVVDMMFVSSNIKVLSKKAPKVDISDHLPLVCEIEI